MKRFLAILLAMSMVLCACGCGSKTQSSDADEEETEAEEAGDWFEVKITMGNLHDYFEYREFHSNVKSDEGEITSVQNSYGFALRDEYTAANLKDHPDTLSISFTANCVVNTGSYSVDYSTLQYSGTTDSTESFEISDKLQFWPKGDRTSVYPYGVYSDTYISYLDTFTVTAVSGSVFLKYAEAEEG